MTAALSRPASFRGSRIKAAGLTLIVSLMLSLGAWLIVDLGANRAAQPMVFGSGILLVSLGVFLLPVGIGAIAVPMRLDLNREGFTFVRFPIRPRKYLWTDIAAIGVARFRGVEKVSWVSARPTISRRAAWAIFGHDGGLPAGWTVSAEEIADAMSRFRDAAVGIEDKRAGS